MPDRGEGGERMQVRRPVLIGGLLLLLVALAALLARGLIPVSPRAPERPAVQKPAVPKPAPPKRIASAAPPAATVLRPQPHLTAPSLRSASRTAPHRRHARAGQTQLASAVHVHAPHRRARGERPRPPSLDRAVPDQQAYSPAHAARSEPGPARTDIATGTPAASSAPIIAADATPIETPALDDVVTLSAGTARMIRLPRQMAGVFVADQSVADVRVAGSDMLYLLAKKAGLTSVYATDIAGRVLWSRDVRVGLNLADAGSVLRAALPGADLRATPIGGMLLLTGRVASADEAAAAERIATQVTAGTVPVINRLAVAMPQQVNLQVKIAEVSRQVTRAIGLDYKTGVPDGAFKFGIAQGRAGAISDDLASITGAGAGTTVGLGGRLAGLDIRQAIDLAETDGLATTLAEPNLTALSGETASFLAGGEIPIAQSQGLGSVAVEYKQYGVSLAFTPTVLSGGRIALRVRPEVSQLTDVGAVTINGYSIPGFTTRRAETTLELGSGQSMAIGGLIQNSHNNNVDKAPILGDLPVIGALFRSDSFRKDETELVIVVTPYLVNPVDPRQVALPTDGYRAATPVGRVVAGQEATGDSGSHPPVPVPAPTDMPVDMPR